MLYAFFQAFVDLGFKADEVTGLYSIVSAVLNLGNVEFKETSPDQAGVTKDTKKYADNAADLLKLDVGQLAKCLTHREIRVRVPCFYLATCA